MGCSVGPQEFVLTITASDGNGAVTEVDGRPVCDGFFNPVTGLLDTTRFDRVRMTIEILSATPNMGLMCGGRSSPDGITIEASASPFGDVIVPADEWFRTGWFPAGVDSPDFIQAGVFGFRTGGSSALREMAVIRFRIEFKMGT